MQNPSPILILTDQNSENKLSSYITEILQTEGFLDYEVKDLSRFELDMEELLKHDIVILSNIPLSSEQKAILTGYVQKRGGLIGLRPPRELGFLFRLRPLGEMLSERYIKLETLHPLSDGIEAETLQYHGEADLYALNGAYPLAFLCQDLDSPTPYPAIATYEYARGRTAIFAYDLTSSTVLFHQGRYAQSSIGDYPDPDGDGMYKPTDLFLNHIDIRLKQLPQADLQQDILVKIIEWMAGFTKPLPRIWHFPDKEKGLVFIGGDSDGMSLKDFETTISTVEEYGGVYTTYLMEEQYGVVTPQQEQYLRERGYSFGPHLWQGRRPSLSEMRQGMKEEIEHFRERYGHTPVSSRGHSVIWVGWSEQAKYLSENGIRLSCNFTGGKYIREGYVAGSGLPWKFIDEKGKILDIYEQPYQMNDDGSMHDKSYLPPLTLEEVIQRSYEFMDASFKKYHNVFQVSVHPIYIGGSADLPSKEWVEAVLAKCKQENLRTVSADEWVRFNDARRAIKFRNLQYDPQKGTLIFDFQGSIPASPVGCETTPGARGITFMLSARHLDRAICSVAIDNAPVEHNVTTLGGNQYALFVVDIENTEWHRVEARYNRQQVTGDWFTNDQEGVSHTVSDERRKTYEHRGLSPAGWP